MTHIFDTLTPEQQAIVSAQAEDALSMIAKRKAKTAAGAAALAPKIVKAHTTLAPTEAKTKKVSPKAAKPATTTTTSLKPSMKSINAMLEANGLKVRVVGANYKISIILEDGKSKDVSVKTWGAYSMEEWLGICKSATTMK